MKTAKAAVFTGVEKPFDIREYPVDRAPAGMAGIRMIASGVCGTDIHFHRGRIPLEPPKIIGHELVGRVEDLAEEDGRPYGLKVGDHVIVDIASPCGECLLCHSGDEANCLHMGVTNGGDPEQPPHLWGGYAEYNYSPVGNLIRIPASLDPTLVCVYACAGPTALHAFALAERANCGLEKAQVAVVQGLGPVGTFAVAYLASLGIPHVAAVTAGNNPAREALARDLGATDVLNLDASGEEEVIRRIRRLSGDIGADLVFEASGSPKAIPVGMRMLRNRGVYLVPGQYSNSGEIAIQPQLITFSALQILGSSQYSVADVETYLRFIGANPRLHPIIRSLIAAYPLEQVDRAFEDAKAGKNVKTILIPSGAEE